MATPTRGGRAGTSFDMNALAPVAIGQNGPLIYDGAGQAWMPAGTPLPVTIQPAPEPRVLDYPVFWNRQTPAAGKAKDSGGVTFAQLRALSKQTHVRVVIETVKDRQSKIEWSYTLRAKPGESPREAQQRTKDDPRLDRIEDFFGSPDRDSDWMDWERDMLEQVLVCDNLSLLRRDYKYGEAREIMLGEGRSEPFGVEIINGDTIFPLIDDTGRRPQPPEIAYQQWIRGMRTSEFTTDELMYAPRNVSAERIYSAGSPCEQLLFYINMIMRRDITKLDFYTKGNMPAGFLPLPENWTEQQVIHFTDWLNIALAGDQENRSKIWPVPGGTGKIDWAQKEILQDTFDDAWLRLVCFCFSIPVSSLVREQTRATADSSKKQAQEEGEAVLVHWISTLQTKIIRKWFGWADIVALPKEAVEIDPQKRAEIDDKKLRNGTLQIDEVREREGLDPFNLEPGIVTATGWIALVPPDPIVAAPDPNAPPPPFGAKPKPTTAEIVNVAKVKKNSGLVKMATDAHLSVILQSILSDNSKLQAIGRGFHVAGITLGAAQIAAIAEKDLTSKVTFYVGGIKAGPVSINDPRVIEFLRTRENKIVSVNETTGQDIIDAILAGVAAGETYEEIEQAIRDVYDLRIAQSEVIARNEVGSALSGGRFFQMGEEGVSEHDWHTSMDARVRESHAVMEGEIAAVGEQFSNGCRYPQDPDGDPDETIACRCVSFPVFGKVEKRDRRARADQSIAAAAPIEKKMTAALSKYFAAQRERVIAVAKSISV